MRSLTLHVSALSDKEYTLFTSSVTIIVAPLPPPKTDDDYTNLTFPMRSARLFLCGRCPDFSFSDLDQIFDLIATGPSQDATLTSGQFFAIYRLILHVRGGAELDSDLVFTQSSVRDDVTAFGSPPFKRPRLDALEAGARLHLESVSAARAAPTPLSVAKNVEIYKEEQTKWTIYDGRPIELHGPPVEIYNETLAKLKHDLCDLSNAPEPSDDYISQTANLFRASAPIYDSELLWRDAVFRPLCQLLDADVQLCVKTSTEKSSRFTTEEDAAICENLEDVSYGEKAAVVAYLELKNELGLRGQAGLPAALSLCKHVSQKNYEEIRNVSCCPSIIISLAGPYLQISGAIFVEVFTVQPFTNYIYLGGNPFAIKQAEYVARVFQAVARAVNSLRGYYFHLRVRDQPKFHSPSPTYLPNSPPVEDLEFEHRVLFGGEPDYGRSLFHAKYGDHPVLVKFCETYGESAHRMLAAVGLAPALHYCSQILGGAFMVVMDQVQGQDAFHQFRHRDLPSTVLEDIQLALKTLHDLGHVFGDVRRPNMMVLKIRNQDGNDEWHGQLVDFDWSGQVGNARYPPTLNKNIRWPCGVEAGCVIEKQHDLDMLDAQA